MRITAVTGFYDVGRAGYDGRTVEDYVSWLNKTLQVPLDFLVFLDPEFDASKLSLKPGDRIIPVAKNDFRMFGHRGQIDTIVNTSKAVNRWDISFHLAEYGMLVMSKLEMMKRAADQTDNDYLIWIDAGLSRFLPDLRGSEVKITDADLVDTKLLVGTSYHFSQRRRIGRFPHKLIGSTQSMMSAGDFIVARDAAEDLSDRLDFLVETEWLPQGKWDNEQVAIGSLMFRGGIPGVRILHTDQGPLAPVTRWIFGQEFYPRKTPLHVWWKLLLDEVRTRRTPLSECYLPGDFPEDSYQQWRRGRSR